MPARWSATAVTGPAMPPPAISALTIVLLPQEIFRSDELNIGYTGGHDKPLGTRPWPGLQRGHGDVPHRGGRQAGAQRQRGEGPRPAGTLRSPHRRRAGPPVRAGSGVGDRADQPAGAEVLRQAHPAPQRPAQHPGRGRRRAHVRPRGPAVRRVGPLTPGAVRLLQRRAARGDPPLPHRGRPPPAGGHRPPHRRRGAVKRTSTVGVLVLGAAVGLLLSLYGPAIPRLREAYGVGGGGSGLVLTAHFAGAMTGIGWWGLERRLAARTWLRVATALLVAGATGIAFAPTWPLVLAAAFGLGVGFGVVVVEINVLLADAFGERAPAMLNLLGVTFGAGAMVGPLTIAATGGYRLPLCAGALLAVAALSLTRDLPRTATAPEPGW